ncbi:MAG: ATP-binding protein [Rhodospirillaceae bacterium]
MTASIAATIKKFLPRSLFGRSLMIIVTPLVLLQIVSAAIFYETHWDKVMLRLARSVAGDIAVAIVLLRDSPGDAERRRVFDLASRTMQMTMSIREKAVLESAPPAGDDLMERMLGRALREAVHKPFRIDADSMDRDVIIDVQLSDGILRVVTPRKRLFSSTSYVFVVWLVGTSLILFAVATIFMRNQVKPIRRLADAAETCRKGRDLPHVKPEGATEVRQAASAFLAMRERIVRQIRQRTDMLAGVSHDLRTPLTRMRLQVEMLGDDANAEALKGDIAEMEHMLEGYLAFARGDGTETPTPTNLTPLLEGVAEQGRRKGGLIDLHVESAHQMPLRAAAFKRCLTNLVDNAIRFGTHVTIRAGLRGDKYEITIDDDGPGIAEEFRADVFKPFFRVEESRNRETGGVGLGLTIVGDVVRSHGGTIALTDAPSGGLRVRLVLPV